MLVRALPLIQKALDSLDTDDASLENLKTEITAITDGKDAGLSPFAVSGARGAKERLLKNIQALQAQKQRDSIDNVRKQLSKIKETNAKLKLLLEK